MLGIPTICQPHTEVLLPIDSASFLLQISPIVSTIARDPAIRQKHRTREYTMPYNTLRCDYVLRGTAYPTAR